MFCGIDPVTRMTIAAAQPVEGEHRSRELWVRIGWLHELHLKAKERAW
jgi:hypothetical protein